MAYKLVIADSSPSVQKVVQMAFSDPDFEVFPFDNGLDLIGSLDQLNPDAVLLNLSLPAKDGYEVNRFLRSRENFRKTALILLKNAFEPLDAERIQGLDHDGVVQKPFDSERLVLLVRDIIDRKRGPHSYPEEFLPEEIPVTGTLPLFEETGFQPSASLPFSEEDIEDKIKRVIREEILSMERELEKRLRASLRAEVRAWLERGAKKTP
jgi:DNA-binding response OmpR family regulator